MRAIAVIVLLLAVLAAPGCQMNERLSGTVLGGVGGAVIGGVASGVGGAFVGGLAGALVGYLVGDYLADQRERGRPSVFGSHSDTEVAAAEASHVRAARTAYEKGRSARTSLEARRWYQESLRLNPGRPEPLNMLGLTALAAGEPREAERYLRQALELDPLYKPAKHNLARLHLEYPSR